MPEEMIAIRIRTFGPGEIEDAIALRDVLLSEGDGGELELEPPRDAHEFALIPVLVGAMALATVGKYLWDKIIEPTFWPTPCTVVDCRKNPVEIYTDPDGPKNTIVTITADGTKTEIERSDEVTLESVLDALKKAVGLM